MEFSWYSLLISFASGLIMCLISLVLLGRKMKQRVSVHRGKSGWNSIMESEETIVTVLNPKETK